MVDLSNRLNKRHKLKMERIFLNNAYYITILSFVKVGPSGCLSKILASLETILIAQ
jgi:hypothetical protein